MGLQLLEREKIALKGTDKDVQPDLPARNTCWNASSNPKHAGTSSNGWPLPAYSPQP